MANLDGRYAVDDRPLAFVNHHKGSLISLAGPGTGKTYSFLQRIKSLISTGESQAKEICYLTFIKEISKAFLSDYYEEFSREQSNIPRVSTLHSFACRLLRNRGFTIGYDGPLHFASTADHETTASQVFLSDLLPLVLTSGPRTIPQLRNLLQQVKKNWRDNVNPKTLPHPIPKILDTCLELAKAYRLVDWDQAIPMAHDLFRQPSNRQGWLTELQHYLVDEYQVYWTPKAGHKNGVSNFITPRSLIGVARATDFRIPAA